MSETYVHRIGRTARAGASGVAIAFCTPEERGDLAAIEKLTRVAITPIGEVPYWDGRTPKKPPQNQGRGGRGQQNGGGGRDHGRPAGQRQGAKPANGGKPQHAGGQRNEAPRRTGRSAANSLRSEKKVVPPRKGLAASRSCSKEQINDAPTAPGGARTDAQQARTGQGRSSRSTLIPSAQGHTKDDSMAKEELLEFDGTVVEVLPDGNYRVKLDNDHVILAYAAGKMKKNRIRTIAGDRVVVEMSPYDLDRGRINFRQKTAGPGPGGPPRNQNFRRR